MADDPVQQGTVPFKVPSIEAPCRTYYKIFGELKQSNAIPLVVLHGGPGSGHEYMLPFSKLWSSDGIPVVFYDQIGCAASTHLPQRAGDSSLWQIDLFIMELENFLGHLGLGSQGIAYDLLGHSFGGMIGATFAGRQPVGLRRLILAAPPASVELFNKGAWRLLERLSAETQEAVKEAVKNDDYTTPSYKAAAGEWARTYWNRADPWPAGGLAMAIKHQADDPTVRSSLAGRASWASEGSMIRWSCIPTLSQIVAPTLVYNGEFDTTQDDATIPFFDKIPRVRWVTFAKASHMHHLDSPELEHKVLRLVREFLRPQREAQG